MEVRIGVCFAKRAQRSHTEIQCVNGREIRFDFNDKRRARARCKHCTNYLVYVSKVGQSKTYRLNTLHPKHTCVWGRRGGGVGSVNMQRLKKIEGYLGQFYKIKGKESIFSKWWKCQ